jgi:hypothetical protein
MKTKMLFYLLFVLNFAALAQKSDSIAISSKTAWLISTNFNVPTVTFRPVLRAEREKTTTVDRGNLSFFNAVGAGISISRANFKLLNSKNDTTGTEINNQVGFQVGFLFSRSTTTVGDKNRFALQMGVNFLDFQIGFGKEFIDVPTGYNSKFITISYSLPITKFSRKTAFVLKNNGGGKNGKLSRINKGFSI